MAVHAVVAGHEVETDLETVLKRLREARPEPIRKHYVIAEGRRFPVIQALSLITGIDRTQVQSQQALRLLRRLGLVTGRLGDDTTPAVPVRGGAARSGSKTREEKAEVLRPYMGQWVAVDQDWSEVLYAGASPHEVVGWLRRTGTRARGGVFRVPSAPMDSPGFAF